MTPSDIARLLDYLAKAYPTAPAPESMTPLIWLEHFNEMGLETARQAAHQWVDREKWAPSIAEFKAECVSVERVAYLSGRAELEHAELVASRVAPETATENRLRLITEMRAMLHKQAKNVHNHKWPNPCKVCGGMGPPPKDEQVGEVVWRR